MSTPTIREGLTLLRDPNIGRLFIAYLISHTGTAMAPIAMAFGVLELTGSAADSAIVIAAPTLASIGVLLFGGVIADRTSRRRIIYCADITASCAQAGLAYLFLSGTATLTNLTALMLVNGFAGAFRAPAGTAIITQLVAREDLQTANALLGTARNSAVAGGAALGGILVATVGPGYTLAIDAISFAASAALVFSLKPRPSAARIPASILDDLRLGWREFTSHTWLWTIVLQFSLIVAAGEAVFGLIGPAVARDALGGARDWGYIAAGFGIGTLIGGLLAIRVRPVYPMRFATCCVFLFAGVELTLMVPLSIPLITLAACISGIAGQTFAVLWYTTLQTKVPEHLLSRVSAYDHLGSIALAPLGIVFAGLLYESLGFRTTLIIAAAAIVISTAAVLCVRDVRHMRSD